MKYTSEGESSFNDSWGFIQEDQGGLEDGRFDVAIFVFLTHFPKLIDDMVRKIEPRRRGGGGGREEGGGEGSAWFPSLSIYLLDMLLSE